MDRKSIIVIAVSFVVLLLWFPLVNKIYPPGARTLSTNAPAATASTTNAFNPGGATTSTTGTPPPTWTQGTQTTATATAPTVPALPSDVKEQTLELITTNVHYTFTSRGGGLARVELLQYPETVARTRGKTATSEVAMLNTFTPAPTLAILGNEAVQGDGMFELSRIPGGIRASKTLTNGLTIVKEFVPGTNYLLETTTRLENGSTQPLSLPAQEWFVGTSTPLNPKDNGAAVGVMWYDGAKTQETGQSYFSDRNFACMPKTPPAEYRVASSNVIWVATHNQFFALTAMPKEPAVGVVVRKVSLAGVPEFAGGGSTPPAGYGSAMVYPAVTLAPGEHLNRNITFFAGPKEYQTLVRIGTRFNNNVDQVMGYGGFFGFFAKGLLLAMNWLHDNLKFSYGVAIIAITVLVKLLFWPLTQASTRSMKRMQALQPQMKAIQEKYKADPAKMNRKTMEFMREHKVSPLGGCLPMIIQMPVFFGFYKMIQSAIELRGASFLWIGDLSQPDTLFTIPGTGFPFNLLPLIMGATMLWQARLTPPSPGMDPTQAKMMRYMPLMFLFILYNFSAGLTLYWTVQNLLTIAQTKLTRTNPEPAAPAVAPLTPAPKKRKIGPSRS